MVTAVEHKRVNPTTGRPDLAESWAGREGGWAGSLRNVHLSTERKALTLLLFTTFFYLSSCSFPFFPSSLPSKKCPDIETEDLALSLICKGGRITSSSWAQSGRWRGHLPPVPQGSYMWGDRCQNSLWLRNYFTMQTYFSHYIFLFSHHFYFLIFGDLLTVLSVLWKRMDISNIPSQPSISF